MDVRPLMKCLLTCSYECEVGNKTEYLVAYEKTPQQFQDNPIIHWEAIIWIYRPMFLWIIEIFFAVISLTEALLVAYLSYKVLLMPLVTCNPLIDQLIVHGTGKCLAASDLLLLYPRTGQHHSLHFYGN